MEIVYERVAGIDVGKKEVAVTVRVPGQASGSRAQQTRKFRTFYQVLRQMVGWLADQGVTHVAMEATGVYWKPVFHALCEPDTLEVVLVNARHVKNVPGRKTVKDSKWLAQLLECGLLRGSFIPPREIAAIRELTRYRKKTIQTRTRELQRLCKVLEDAGIKIDSVGRRPGKQPGTGGTTMPLVDNPDETLYSRFSISRSSESTRARDSGASRVSASRSRPDASNRSSVGSPIGFLRARAWRGSSRTLTRNYSSRARSHRSHPGSSGRWSVRPAARTRSPAPGHRYCSRPRRP